MTGSKVDPRVVKTRSSLRKALVYLMKHEKLENISVQKITETANITRGTFYLHYKDKRDFIKSAMNEILDDLFAKIMVERQISTSGASIQVLSLNEAFQCIENSAEVFDVLLNNERNDFFYGQLYDRLCQEMTEYAKQLGTEFDDFDVPIKMQVSFLASAVLGVIKSWLQDGMIYTPRYMTQSMMKMLQQFSGEGMLLTSFFDGKVKSALEI